MRFVAALAGVLLSALPLIFFWVGTQTFLRPLERALAFVMVVGTGALLVLSLALFFTPSVQRVQGITLLTIMAIISLILIAYRLLR